MDSRAQTSLEDHSHKETPCRFAGGVQPTGDARLVGAIRVARAEDAGAIAAIKAPYVRGTAYNFAWEPPTAAETAADIVQTLRRYPFLMATGTGGEATGFAQAEPVRHRESDQWAVELSVYVAENAQGKGIGSALYHRLLALLQQQGVLDAYACITAENMGSIAFHKRMGFAEVGRFPHAGYKLGAWHDTVWMHLALGSHVCPPKPFVPFSQLAKGA